MTKVKGGDIQSRGGPNISIIIGPGGINYYGGRNIMLQYHCGERLPRRQLAEHEQDVCPQRPVDVKLESFMRKMEERHMREMAAVRENHMREMATVREELEIMKQVTNELKKENGSYRSELETMKKQVKGLEKKLAEHKVGCFWKFYWHRLLCLHVL